MGRERAHATNRHEKAPSAPTLEASETNVNLIRKNVEMNDTTAIAPDNLPVISHAGRPVVTTALLAKLYGAEVKNIQNNYARNAERFEHGKHFFKVEGADLAELKNRPSLRGSVLAKAKSVMLWTERGAARHAKMLETDEAWEVFEKLEDCYFGNTAQVPDAPVPCGLTPGQQRHIQQRVAALANHDKEKFASVYGSIKDRYRVGSYKDVPSEKYRDLCTFLMCKPLDSNAPEPGQYETIELENCRWLLSFDPTGQQQVIPVPIEAAVLTKQQFLKGLFIDRDIPLSTEEMFTYVIAGIVGLQGQFSHSEASKKA